MGRGGRDVAVDERGLNGKPPVDGEKAGARRKNNREKEQDKDKNYKTRSNKWWREPWVTPSLGHHQPPPQQRLLAGWAPPAGVDGGPCSGLTQGIYQDISPAKSSVDAKQQQVDTVTLQPTRTSERQSPAASSPTPHDTATHRPCDDHVTMTRSPPAGYDFILTPVSPSQDWASSSA